MNSITISRAQVKKNEGVVVLSIKEYQRLLVAAVPTYFLTGKAAKDLDKLTEEGLREHRAGKTISADSVLSAVKQYRKKYAR